MINLFAAALVVGVALFLAQLERRISRFEQSRLSPFVLLAIPYTVVFLVQVCSISLYDLTPLSPLYVAFVLMHFFIVWLVCILFEGQSQSVWPKVSSVDNLAYDRYIKLFLILGVIVSAIQIMHFFFGGRSVSIMGEMVQEEFQTEYSSGIYFYLRLMSMLCAAYLIAGINRERVMLLLAAAFCLLPVFLTFVKSVVILSVIAGIIGNLIVNKKKITLKDAILTLALGIAIFFGVYLVEICIWDLSKLTNPETYRYVFDKMLFYLITGPQSFNVVVGSPIAQSSFTTQVSDNLIMAPLINVMHWFGLADRVLTFCPVWTLIGAIPGLGVVSGNVYTMIGEYVLYCGPFGSIVAEIFFTSLVCHFYVSYHRSGSPLSLLVYCMFGAFFFLGWFDNYFTQTFWVYMLVMVGVIHIATSFLSKISANNLGRDASAVNSYIRGGRS